jgi:hypothetical protein
MHKYIVLIIIFSSFNLVAQYNFTSGSGELKGIGGSASQSIGQIAYTTYQSDSGRVNQGVIQPYQISVISGEDISNIVLSLRAFPNPVSNILNLEVLSENFLNEHQQLSYQFFDINGRLLRSSKINESLTEISVSDLPPATYFLQIIQQDKNIKTFKIVKSTF